MIDLQIQEKSGKSVIEDNYNSVIFFMLTNR